MKPKRLISLFLSLALAAGFAFPVLATGFSDVRPDAWYAEAVAWASEKGVMGGYGGGTFGPDESVTRAQFSAVLYRAAGSPAVNGQSRFPDVGASDAFAAAVGWASTEGLMNGYADGSFGRNDPVTRQQVAAVLWRYAGSPAASGNADFSDVSQVSDYARNAVNWIGANGIMNADGNRFRPTDNATRAEIAASVRNYYDGMELENSGGKTLIAWFSRANNIDFDPNVDATTSASINLIGGNAVGNAKLLADMVQAAVGGDEFAIETAEKYPSAYRATTNQARTEQSAQARPELSTHVSNWEDYDTVILIYPCWWSGLPMPVYTFLEEYDFTGKTVLPLCTHEGSGMGSTQRELEDACPGATVLTGLAVRGGSVSGAAANVENWLHDAGIFA